MKRTAAKPVGKRRARAAAAETFTHYVARGGEIPVDVRRILVDDGVHVIEEPAESDLAGMLLVDGGRAVIVANSRDAPVRRRFTLAHELGHLQMHWPKGSAVFHRDEQTTRGTDPVEIDANTFAAELLMPEDEIRAEAEHFKVDLVDEEALRALAKKFDVSMQAMMFRLHNLGILKLDNYW